MTNWKSVRIGCAAAALALMLAGSAIALGSHENRLTFNRPVSLPGVVLPAGAWRNELTGEEVTGGPAHVGRMLSSFPVALLVRRA